MKVLIGGFLLAVYTRSYWMATMFFGLVWASKLVFGRFLPSWLTRASGVLSLTMGMAGMTVASLWILLVMKASSSHE